MGCNDPPCPTGQKIAHNPVPDWGHRVKSQGFEFQIEICLLLQAAPDLDLCVHARWHARVGCLSQDRLNGELALALSLNEQSAWWARCTSGGLILQNVAFAHLQQLFASGVKAAVFLPVKFHSILFCFIFFVQKKHLIQFVCVYMCVCVCNGSQGDWEREVEVFRRSHWVGFKGLWKCLVPLPSGLFAIFNICPRPRLELPGTLPSSFEASCCHGYRKPWVKCTVVVSTTFQ